MYEISIETTFDAAHNLREYEGICGQLHGHTYKALAKFRVKELQDSGIAVDFRHVKKLINEAAEYMDHQYINDLPEFSIQNPTAENIARYIYERVRAECSLIYSVSVWETPTSCATYYEDE
jgi:6-pyruvoyltetrahydropterin/6-carboxytetrahydropterin synthase